MASSFWVVANAWSKHLAQGWSSFRQRRDEAHALRDVLAKPDDRLQRDAGLGLSRIGTWRAHCWDRWQL